MVIGSSEFSNRAVPTNELADEWLNVDVLQVLTGARMIQSQCTVETNRHPDSIANPRHLPHLTLTTRMNIK